MNRPIVLCLTSLLALAAACGDKQAAADSTKAPRGDTTMAAPAAADTTKAPPAAVPTVTIVSPAENDSTGPDVPVVLSHANVTIAKADSKRATGTGHFHLFLDTIPAMDTMPIPPTSKQIVHIGTGDSTFTFKGLKPGPHTIIAVLGYGNHVAMTPETTDTVHFVVKSASKK
jgi:hypothetical protein